MPNKKIKIAVLFYGRLNFCDSNYGNLLDALNYDEKTMEIDFFMSSDASSEALLETFKNVYKPVAFDNSEIEYGFNYDSYEKFRVCTDSMTRHFINVNRVFDLYEKHVNAQMNENKYDAILCTRIDLVYVNGAKYNFENIEPNTLYVPIIDDSWTEQRDIKRTCHKDYHHQDDDCHATG